MSKLMKRLRNHFIPHEGNEFRPHVLRHKSLAFIASFVIVIKVIIMLLVALIPGYVLPIDITNQNIINLTNQQRVNSGLSQLALNNKLSQAAASKAQDMLSKQYFSHYSPSNTSPWYWFKAAGYEYAYAGENLAMDFTTAEDMMSAWMASASHKKNILNGQFSEIGVAVLEGDFKGAKTILVVQVFAVPAPTPTVASETTVEEVAEESPPQEEVTEEVKEEQKLPEVEKEKTVVIPSPVEEDTYDVKVTVKEEAEEPKEEPTKVAVQIGDNTNELTKSGDEYIGAVKEDKEGPEENIKVVLEDSQKNVISYPVMNTNYFKTSILRPDRFFTSDRLIQILFHSRNFFLALLIFLSLVLILNVLVRIRVQHRPTILYSLLLIYMIGVIIII